MFTIKHYSSFLLFRICVERVTRIANSIETFKSLVHDDQSALLKENADLLVSLRGAMFFDSSKKGVDQVLLSMGAGMFWLSYVLGNSQPWDTEVKWVLTKLDAMNNPTFKKKTKKKQALR